MRRPATAAEERRVMRHLVVRSGPFREAEFYYRGDYLGSLTDRIDGEFIWEFAMPDLTLRGGSSGDRNVALRAAFEAAIESVVMEKHSTKWHSVVSIPPGGKV